ncbi:XdhC protein (assists in molybdopterin insertion into xanthine dehydrogenase) [Rubellimicrobium mesophilum DSM 19309]|uniref:XdhC protein (Assists in molybdopterin insertion into xanthine dehydrogenase) n=1 Tax=Rubellimicrobium mesophilum DSM 19309 TaxID=442562 RepID=A0A017HLJ4_9RHOB|nr:xanthine dehydrogenase accessory protein XdhC [Rubellimicrobium mesophilum]EYD75023.1 XdhC protein (assists in molybdopterin insertion into xanthine dehydrogenase) [Rubellimicrobium mesophilum DSM 19309]
MIRVRVARARGSTPREEGAEMFVGPDRTVGTIGGGQLEYLAIDRARQMLRHGEAEATMDVPLGPEIGQCCGGRVELRLDRAGPAPRDPGPPVLIFGAGHVGRALAAALLPLPLSPRLIDQRPEELALAPLGMPTTLTPLPENEVRKAPPGAAYVILTHDHALDFLLALEALARPDAAYVGMIGSRSKRATFTRLAREHGADATPLVCPIGAGFPGDKRPEVIAAFTAAELLTRMLDAPPVGSRIGRPQPARLSDRPLAGAIP